MAKELRNILVNHMFDKQLLLLASKYLNGQMLDIGCGTKPYAQLLSFLVTMHIGVDHRDTLHDKSNIDIFGAAYDIPVENSSFDCGICTAVFEQLEEPELAVPECYRALKPGGIAICSAPFIWHLHEEPRDFYHFSIHGLRHLFGRVGFQIIEIRPLSGFWVTFGQLFVCNLYRFNSGPLRWLRIADAMGLLIQGVAYILGRFDKTEEWTWMSVVVARKP